MMTIQTIDGKAYDIRFGEDQNFEIERDDAGTGLRKVFVFQDLSIGNAESKRKEVVFYAYDITPTGERINKVRHSFADTASEFRDLLSSALWETVRTGILSDFFKKIEFVEPVKPTE